MLDTLPPPDDSVLARAPANVVVFSLGFEQERDLRPADGIAWQRALEKHGQKAASLQKVVQRSINVQALFGPGSTMPASIAGRDGWQAGFRGKASAAAVYRDGVILERQQYPGFSEFRKEIRAVCASAADILNPSLRTRLGLRYSNALSSEEAVGASYWRGKVEPAFLSIANDDRLSSSFDRSFCVVDFSGEGVTLQVRCGLQPDVVYEGRVAFVFDIDLTKVALSAFSVDSCMDEVVDLNRYARQIFQTIITPEYYLELRGPENA